MFYEWPKDFHALLMLKRELFRSTHIRELKIREHKLWYGLFVPIELHLHIKLRQRRNLYMLKHIDLWMMHGNYSIVPDFESKCLTVRVNKNMLEKKSPVHYPDNR